MINNYRKNNQPEAMAKSSAVDTRYLHSHATASPLCQFYFLNQKVIFILMVSITQLAI